jgi:hypothetical protein
MHYHKTYGLCARAVDRVIHRLHIRRIRDRVEFVIDDRFGFKPKAKNSFGVSAFAKNSLKLII